MNMRHNLSFDIRSFNSKLSKQFQSFMILQILSSEKMRSAKLLQCKRKQEESSSIASIIKKIKFTETNRYFSI